MSANIHFILLLVMIISLANEHLGEDKYKFKNKKNKIKNNSLIFYRDI